MDAPEKESVHASCCIRMEEIAKSVIVRADDFQHLIENLFHLPHQCELGAGAVEVRSEERRVGKECRSRWSPYH